VNQKLPLVRGYPLAEGCVQQRGCNVSDTRLYRVGVNPGREILNERFVVIGTRAWHCILPPSPDQACRSGWRDGNNTVQVGIEEGNSETEKVLHHVYMMQCFLRLPFHVYTGIPHEVDHAAPSSPREQPCLVYVRYAFVAVSLLLCFALGTVWGCKQCCARGQ
jgi:hypothetical protein